MKDKKRQTLSRRQSLGLIAGGAGLLAARPIVSLPAQESSADAIVIDPTRRAVKILGKVVGLLRGF